MRYFLRFIFLLGIGLGLLTWLGWQAVHYKTREWFNRDITLRAQLAAKGLRHAAIDYFEDKNKAGLKKILTEISHDERIMAASVCGYEGSTVVETDEFPLKFSCTDLAKSLAGVARGDSFQQRDTLGEKVVYVSAIPLTPGKSPAGFMIFVQDLTFAERREEQTQWTLVWIVFILGIAASALTLFLSRDAWREWNREVRVLLRGEQPPRKEFEPILSDVRDLVERLAVEREIDFKDGIWNPERLRQALQYYLKGDRVLALANREPYIHEITESGIKLLYPASGLVTALEPIMRACSGVWIAHGSGSGDKQTVDAHSHIKVPPNEEAYTLRRIWLTEQQEIGYYYGFSNEGLWPLCHTADTRPIFRTDDWNAYVEVNKLFAAAACDEAASDDPIILVQDYHLALAPYYIRQRLPKATIISFWHIPWPTAERFGICPRRNELLLGLLGSSIVGFHTQAHCNNFIDSVERFLETRIDREQNAVIQQGRQTLVRPYPISIEWPVRWLSEVPPVDQCRASVREQLGLGDDSIIGLGIDRLDYTKGVEERLLAVERLLENEPSLRGKLTFIQLAAPSRTKISQYQKLNETIERVAARVNERFAAGNYKPIVLLKRHHERLEVFKFYRAAHFCYISSLHDGMNLVAKEFIAAREDERGVLILSQFTGASKELTEALLVNPYDVDEASRAISVAVRMPESEQVTRMRSMRLLLAEFNVYRWAGRMLIDAARLRRRERLYGALSSEKDFSQAAGI